MRGKCFSAIWRKSFIYLSLLFSFIFLFTELGYAQTAIDDLVKLNYARARRAAIGTAAYNVSITNTSDKLILSPITVVIDSISHTSVTVANADGTTPDGKPYFLYESELSDDNLAPAETSAQKKWVFNNPRGVRFSFTTKVLGDVAEAFGTIGPEGGVVEVTDTNSPIYGAKLLIPEGGLNEETVITISEPLINPPIPDGFIGEYPIELRPSGLTFNLPVQLVIPLNGYVNGIFYIYNSETEEWDIVDTVINTITGDFEIKMNHFSLLNLICGGFKKCRNFDVCTTSL